MGLASDCKQRLEYERSDWATMSEASGRGFGLAAVESENATTRLSRRATRSSRDLRLYKNQPRPRQRKQPRGNLDTDNNNNRGVELNGYRRDRKKKREAIFVICRRGEWFPPIAHAYRLAVRTYGYRGGKRNQIARVEVGA